MEIIFHIMACVFMGVLHCLTINFFSDDKPSFKNYFLGIIPFWGNFYVLCCRRSVIGALYAAFRLLEYPALVLTAFFSKTEYSNMLCLILIFVTFVTCFLRIIHIGGVLRGCRTPVWMIITFSVLFSVELIYIIGVLPYTLQSMFV